MRDAVASGKTFGRVHIVENPLSNYVRYELDASYPENLAAGAPSLQNTRSIR
ncbi:DUF6879 family protein [Candidatus Protofrankia datiscae]|uniref:DUF6879 family protein n=1 Tax=Candidatus Protofrankia datiscae TaxID=2716812 RepID=UPI003D66DC70